MCQQRGREGYTERGRARKNIPREMSPSVFHFVRNPKSLFDKIDEFAEEVGCEQRFVGSKCHFPAHVLVHEWQVDLLDNLPLYLLSSNHVVVADDWRADLLAKVGANGRIKREVAFF